MNSKIFYAYNQDTGEYAGNETAFESPREPGVYLNSPCSTEVEPPTHGDHQAAVYKDGAWALVPDYRGLIYYDTDTLERHEIKALNIEPDAAWTAVVPPPVAHVKWYGGAWVSSDDADAEWTGSALVVPFAVLKARKISEINAYYDGYMANIKKGYSQGEVDTWDVQKQGAEDIIAGNTSTEAAQWVTNLAAGRSAAGGMTITALQLAQRISANVAAASTLQLACLGLQQGLYDKVKALADGDTAGLVAIVPIAPTTKV